MKKILIAGVLAIFGGMLFLNNCSFAVSCPSGTVREGESVDSLTDCNIKKDSDNSLWKTVRSVINVIIGITGVISVVMIIIGGINYTTSQGDAAKTKRATQTILFSVIGLVVTILAFAIVNFVLVNVFGNQYGISSS